MAPWNGPNYVPNAYNAYPPYAASNRPQFKRSLLENRNVTAVVETGGENEAECRRNRDARLISASDACRLHTTHQRHHAGFAAKLMNAREVNYNKDDT